MKALSDKHSIWRDPEKVITTDATPTKVTSMPVSEGDAFGIVALVTGRKQDGTERASYILHGLCYRNVAGSVTLTGYSVIDEQESAAAWDASFNANTTDEKIEVLVTGALATDIDWQARITALRHK